VARATEGGRVTGPHSPGFAGYFPRERGKKGTVWLTRSPPVFRLFNRGDRRAMVDAGARASLSAGPVKFGERAGRTPALRALRGPESAPIYPLGATWALTGFRVPFHARGRSGGRFSGRPGFPSAIERRTEQWLK